MRKPNTLTKLFILLPLLLLGASLCTSLCGCATSYKITPVKVRTGQYKINNSIVIPEETIIYYIAEPYKESNEEVQ